MPQLSSIPTQKSQPWSEDDELNLLAAVLEIAEEPAESYEPRINLFDRIGKIINKSFTNKEVLGKINELKTRCEEKYRDVSVGKIPMFEMGAKIWGDEMMKEDKEKSTQSPANVSDIKDHQELQAEIQQTAKPKSTGSVMDTIPCNSSRPGLKRDREAIEEEDDERSKKKDESGKPFRKKRRRKRRTIKACYNWGNSRNFAFDCPEEKIVNISMKQEHEETPKDTVSLQFVAKNKPDEQPSAPVSASSEIGSHQLESEQTEQKKDVADNSRTGSHQLQSHDTEQRKGVSNPPKTGSRQLQSQHSDQRKEVPDNTKTGSHQLNSQHTEHMKSVPNKSKTGSQLKSQNTEERKEVPDDSRTASHELKSLRAEQRKEVSNNSKTGSHQLKSPHAEQRKSVPNNANTGSHQVSSKKNEANINSQPSSTNRPATKKKKDFKRFGAGSYQLSRHQWNRGPHRPSILGPPAPFLMLYPPPPAPYLYQSPRASYLYRPPMYPMFNPSPTERPAWFSPRR